MHPMKHAYYRALPVETTGESTCVAEEAEKVWSQKTERLTKTKKQA